ncbi:Protein LSM14 like protein B-A [Dictyocoela muelleri]|nr:Protein LSM14 like protein B-A [Dictyocoela muelleri]
MKIEIISKSQCRYEGILKSINKDLTIERVKCFGTEDRKSPLKVEQSTKVYQYITFKLHNIKSIKINNKWLSVTEAMDVLIQNYKLENCDQVNHKFNPEDSKKFYNSEKSFYDDL